MVSWGGDIPAGRVTCRTIFGRKNFVKNRTVVQNVQVLPQSFYTNYRLPNTDNLPVYFSIILSHRSFLFDLFFILWIILFLDNEWIRRDDSLDSVPRLMTHRSPWMNDSSLRMTHTKLFTTIFKINLFYLCLLWLLFTIEIYIILYTII